MRRLGSERGNITIIVSLLLVVLLGAAGLALDIGALLVDRGTLTNGVDAAALAAARDCALHSVEDTPPCDGSAAAEYLEQNGPSGATLVEQPQPEFTMADGKAGEITVEAASTRKPIFAGVLSNDGESEDRVVNAATAAWAPVVAMDVFPLAICRDDSSLEAGAEITIAAGDVDAPPSSPCEPGPGNELPNTLAWLAPAGGDCRASVDLRDPGFKLDNAWEIPQRCNAAVTDLLNAIDDASADPSERTINVALYDPQSGGRRRYPLTALVAFELTGLRLGDREAHGATPWDDACPDDQAGDEIGCIRGFLRGAVHFDTDITMASEDDINQLEGFLADSTVFGVRLVQGVE